MRTDLGHGRCCYDRKGSLEGKDVLPRLYILWLTINGSRCVAKSFLNTMFSLDPSPFILAPLFLTLSMVVFNAGSYLLGSTLHYWAST
jgi:hypothetical protein